MNCRFQSEFEKAIPVLRAELLDALNSAPAGGQFRIVWEPWEQVVCSTITGFLGKDPLRLPSGAITQTQLKSVYPDLSLVCDSRCYAIDIKSAEDAKDPGYDIGRLDTYASERLDKYEEEYSVTVRWRNRSSPKVVQVYIERTYWSVGRMKNGCVKYREYDGKVRPKSWADFDSERVYWLTKADFRKALVIARDLRAAKKIRKWYAAMDMDGRKKIRRLLDSVDNPIQKPMRLR